MRKLKGETLIRRQVKAMQSNFTGTLTARINQVINSGALDISRVEASDYLLARVLLCDAHKYTAEAYQPMTPEGKEMLANLSKF